MKSTECESVFQRSMPSPLATCFTLVSSLAHSSILKIEVTCSPKAMVDFQRTTQHYISEKRATDVRISNPTLKLKFKHLSRLSRLINNGKEN
jgi:hypothetical protein